MPKAFDGHVAFDLTGFNMKTMVIRDAMQRAVPEHEGWPEGSLFKLLFDNLIEFLGRTRSIEFGQAANQQLNEQIEALKCFWQLANTTQDYRVIWQEYLQLEPLVNNEWQRVVQERDNAMLKADPDLQPGAPDELGEKKESTTETASSKRSTGKQPVTSKSPDAVTPSS